MNLRLGIVYWLLRGLAGRKTLWRRCFLPLPEEGVTVEHDQALHQLEVVEYVVRWPASRAVLHVLIGYFGRTANVQTIMEMFCREHDFTTGIHDLTMKLGQNGRRGVAWRGTAWPTCTCSSPHTLCLRHSFPLLMTETPSILTTSSPSGV